MPQVSISYKNPLTQFIQLHYSFEMPEDVVELQFAAWRPGRYELMNYIQKVRNIECDKMWQQLTKDRWAITATKGETVNITYEFYCDVLDAGSTYLDEEQLYINPINCIPYLENCDQSFEIKLHIPTDYRIATALSQQDSTHTLYAKNYAELADSPIIASNHLSYAQFTEAGTLFHIWCVGTRTIDEKLLKNFRKYTAEQISLFGEFPSEDYHYLIQAPNYKHYHGVEHKKSTVVVVGPAEQLFGERYIDLLGVCSHELFHAWNVCRIRTAEMVPYNFTHEQYFETGYILEGITTYYGDYMLGRSGVFSEQQYFDEINLYLNRHFANDGRLTNSLASSSYQLWADGYKAGTPARKSSIYIKGALVAFIADVEIRKATNNTKCLDDVVRKLWKDFGDEKRGYSTPEYKTILEEISGSSFDKYFDQLIFGKDDIKPWLDSCFDYLGLEIITVPNENIEEALYGFKAIKQSHKRVVKQIAQNSPAELVLMLGDIIINTETLSDSISLTIVRKGVEKKVHIQSNDQNYFPNYKIQKKVRANAMQIENYSLWLKK